VRIVSVVGTRPQLIKAAALVPALRARHDEVFVDTGQHYDEPMAGTFFAELGLPRPDHALGIGGGAQGEQTGRMLAALEPVLVDERPDAVLVYGDTNSTLGGALAAAKLGIPVAHVEAGLRSHDRAMPEEINRVVADHLSTWLFAPTPTAVSNLAAEGIGDGVVLVGDLMEDLAARTVPEVRDPGVLDRIATRFSQALGGARLRPGGYLYATVHRADNRAPDALAAWAALFSEIATPERPLVLALHPGTRAALERAGVGLGPEVGVTDPIGYRTSVALQLHAAAVLTDSGGVQREAAWLRTPCLVLRSTTEWVEAVRASGGRMVVVGLDRERVLEELARLAPAESSEELARERAASLDLRPTGAAESIVAALDRRPAATHGARAAPDAGARVGPDAGAHVGPDAGAHVGPDAHSVSRDAGAEGRRP
jgi:UDP-N-acetylglucosamine 2-epimerase